MLGEHRSGTFIVALSLCATACSPRLDGGVDGSAALVDSGQALPPDGGLEAPLDADADAGSLDASALTVASGLGCDDPIAMGVDDLYVATRQGAFRVTKQGGSVSALDTTPRTLNSYTPSIVWFDPRVDPDHVYGARTGVLGLEMFSNTGGAPVQYSNECVDDPTAFASNGVDIYLATMRSQGCTWNGQGGVYRIGLGKPVEVIFRVEDWNTNVRLAVDSTHAYYTRDRGAVGWATEARRLFRRSLTSPDEVLLWPEPFSVVLGGASQVITAVAVDDTNVYWLSDITMPDGSVRGNHAGVLLSMSKAGGPWRVLASIDGEPQDLAVHDGQPYWTVRERVVGPQPDGRIMTVAAGGLPITLARGSPRHIIVDAARVYWTECGGVTLDGGYGRILSLAR